MELPIVDLAAADHDPDGVAREIDAACRTAGFFVVVGHGIAGDLVDELIDAARASFALPVEAKERIAMAKGGRAWRGWFPLGGELTSGRPDHKEGLYLGVDLPPDDPRVLAGTPLHGANLLPAEVPRLGPLVDRYLAAATAVGQRVLALMARALGLTDDWFAAGLTADPTVLFRLFRYPCPAIGQERDGWGVGEHTDYGLLTLLGGDDLAGLEVHTLDGWVAAPSVDGGLVCNLGDMLERMTGGAYRSTPHRVRQPAERAEDRISFPLFLDPGWDQPVRPLPGIQPSPEHRRRWDGADPLAWEGTYGEYLVAKVSRVFPQLVGTVALDTAAEAR